MTRPPMVQNPLHGVESELAGDGARGGAQGVRNPLHGVESIDIMPYHWILHVSPRIHYMELKEHTQRCRWVKVLACHESITWS